MTSESEYLQSLKMDLGSLDHKLLFENIPGLILILLADDMFTIAGMTDAYSIRSQKKREFAIGKSVFEVFPDDPEDPAANGVQKLRESLRRACVTKHPDTMSIQKYSIAGPDGVFKDAYWNAVNSPVCNSAGDVIYIIHKVEDITAYVELKNIEVARTLESDATTKNMEIEVYLRALDLKNINETLKSNEASLIQAKESLIDQLYVRTKALEQAWERSQLALEAGQLGEWTLDLKTGLAYRSLLHDKCFGHSTRLEEWSYDIFLSYVHPEDRELVDKAFKDAISNKTVWDFECRVIWPDKTEHWIRGMGKADFDSLGNPHRMAGIVTDITVRKFKEQEHQKSQSHIRSILDSTVEGIWGVDLQGNISFVNNAAIKLFGFTAPDQLIGKNSHALVHHTRADGSVYPRSECPIFHAFEKGVPCHLENELLWRADGSSFQADYRSTPIFESNKITGTVTSFIDNTERQSLLKSLQENREWLSATLKSIGDAVIATTAGDDPKIVFMNAVAETLTGWSLADAKGKPVLEVFNIINHYTRERAENPIERVIKEFRVVGLANHTVLIAKDGREYVIEDSAAPIVDSQGNLSGVVLVFRDTTEKHLSEERERKLHLEVKKAQENLHTVFMQAPLPIAILMGKDHRFSLANPHYIKLAGREVEGKSLEEAFTDEELNHVRPILDKVFQTGETYIGREMAFPLPDEKGQIFTRYLNLVYQPFKDNSDNIVGVLAILQEVTDQVLARKIVEESKLSIENERANFQNLFQQTPEMVCILSGKDHKFEFVNDAHVKVLGFNATGMTLLEAQPESIEVHDILNDVYRTGVTAELNEIPVTVTNRLRYFNLTYAARKSFDQKIDGVMVLGTEVTEQVLNRETLKLQSRALELSMADVPLQEVLEVMTHLVELQAGNTLIASVLLADKEEKHLLHGAAPGLPEGYNQAIHGIEIGPDIGSCGTAAYTKTITIVTRYPK